MRIIHVIGSLGVGPEMPDQSNPCLDVYVAVGIWMCRLLTGGCGSAVPGFGQSTFFSCVSQTFLLKSCSTGIDLTASSSSISSDTHPAVSKNTGSSIGFSTHEKQNVDRIPKRG
ncbi:hypothetical protein CHS0354_010504 [Potamilus streckersoni]|uniref:Uncharacterized protein n=1 Tax=Potamilus streckersoni TaxID=2493646 RepID=A0AAE0S5M7_9BIVA|nr:hypothetical protein CHS0354_010504 [Potamilus streckersoni]